MYIKRNIQDDLTNQIPRKEYLIISGARQTGKTTLLRILYEYTLRNNPNSYYLSFEDIEILRDVNKHPENLFKYCRRPDESFVNERVIVFIDEMQHAANPSNFMKYLYDTYPEKLKIISTGSSAFYIDEKFDDSLAGRKRIFQLKTLSLDEFLRFKDQDQLIDELYLMRKQEDFISKNKSLWLEILNEYLTFGGYPAITLEPERNQKIEMFKEIKNSFLKRDIDESGITNPDAFYKVLTLLAGQMGNLLNKNELAKTVGVDNKTIEKYTYVLQKCFHIHLLKPFATNIRKELTKMPKVYFSDLGFRNVMLNRFIPFDQREDQGQLLENFVFKRLAEIYNEDEIRFWRTIQKHEIDFVVSPDFRTGKAFEAKLGCTKSNQRAITKFTAYYPEIIPEVITYKFCDGTRQVLKL